MTISERIVSERKRLGLSQAAFATRVGVSLSSQKRYEKGERAPDIAYLDAMHRMGVDVLYVLDKQLPQGLKESRAKMADDFKAGQGIMSDFILGFFLDVLDISVDEWSDIVDKLAKRRHDGILEFISVDPAWKKEIACYSGLILDLVESAATLDSVLLSGILEGLDVALSSRSQSIEPAKKAQAVAMLYRAFKASGKIDQAMIEEAVKLAAA